MYESIKVKNCDISVEKKNDYIVNLEINDKEYKITLIIDECYYYVFNEFISKIINGQQSSFVDKQNIIIYNDKEYLKFDYNILENYKKNEFIFENNNILRNSFRNFYY